MLVMDGHLARQADYHRRRSEWGRQDDVRAPVSATRRRLSDVLAALRRARRDAERVAQVT